MWVQTFIINLDLSFSFTSYLFLSMKIGTSRNKLISFIFYDPVQRNRGDFFAKTNKKSKL